MSQDDTDATLIQSKGNELLVKLITAVAAFATNEKGEPVEMPKGVFLYAATALNANVIIRMLGEDTKDEQQLKHTIITQCNALVEMAYDFAQQKNETGGRVQ